MGTTRNLICALCAALPFGAPALADAPYSDRLTRDWGGARTGMAGHGVTFDLDWTNYYQGLLSGHDYGDRLDAYLSLDTGKLGWWKGGAIRTHAEVFYGDLNPSLGGAVVPTNVDEQGAEVFYDFAATPWLQLTVDLQYVNPAVDGNDNALIGGLRAKIRL